MKRRTLLRTTGGLLAVSAGGCLGSTGNGETGATPSPIDLGGQKRDDRGGMVIGYHGGPNGQIFYASHAPADHGNPARFHTLVFGLFPYLFEHESMGWEATAIYATDYSTVEFDLGEDGRLPAPLAAETFADATAMTYVMGSEAAGGMGPTLVPFSAPTDADSFTATHGGRTVTFDEVTPDLIADYSSR